MQTNPNIILSGNQMAPVQLPDVNAMMQTRTAGMENIYNIEQQRAAQAQAAQKEQEAALVDALAPAYATAFKGRGSKEALTAAYNLLPPEIQPGVKGQIDKLMAMPSDDLRLSALEASLAGSEAGRTLLTRIMTPYQEGMMGLQREQQDIARQRLAMEESQLGMPAPMSAADQARIEIEERRLRIAEEAAAREAAKADAIAAGERGPTEAQKGEVWNRDEGRYDVVPGTKAYNIASKAHTADYKDAAIVNDKIASAQDKLDYILDEKNKDGFEYNFGGYYAAYVGQNMPTEAAQDMFAKLETLKADLKNAGLEQLRAGGSIGQITQAEWPIIEKQIDNITPYMGEKAARDALTSIKRRLDNIAERATEAYDMQWGDTQFYSPVKAKDTGGGGGGAPSPASGGTREGATATNPQTGERVIYRGGQWQPL
jgi:hypothetical protein